MRRGVPLSSDGSRRSGGGTGGWPGSRRSSRAELPPSAAPATQSCGRRPSATTTAVARLQVVPSVAVACSPPTPSVPARKRGFSRLAASSLSSSHAAARLRVIPTANVRCQPRGPHDPRLRHDWPRKLRNAATSGRRRTTVADDKPGTSGKVHGRRHPWSVRKRVGYNPHGRAEVGRGRRTRLNRLGND